MEERPESEIGRMAAALARQNELHAAEQDLRERELDVQARNAEAILLDAQAKEEQARAARVEQEQKEALLESCQNLQKLVRQLVEQLQDATRHKEILDHLEVLARDVRAISGLIGSLSVTVTAIVTEGADSRARQELHDIQERILDILQKSAGSDIVTIGNIRGDRDVDVTAGGG